MPISQAVRPMVKPNTWSLIESVIGVTRRTLVYGPPAVGKSYLAQHFGIEPGEEVFTITLREDSSPMELIGFFMPHGKEFKWFDGPLTSAWKKSHEQKVRFVINEIDHSSGEVFTLLMAALDDIESASMTLPSNETVRPGDGFFVVATMNGDPYADLVPPLRSRFPVRIKVNEINPAALKALDQDVIDIARETSRLEDPRQQKDLRSWAEFCELRKKLGDEQAAWAIFGDQAPEVIGNIRLSR